MAREPALQRRPPAEEPVQQGAHARWAPPPPPPPPLARRHLVGLPCAWRRTAWVLCGSAVKGRLVLPVPAVLTPPHSPPPRQMRFMPTNFSRPKALADSTESGAPSTSVSVASKSESGAWGGRTLCCPLLRQRGPFPCIGRGIARRRRQRPSLAPLPCCWAAAVETNFN